MLREQAATEGKPEDVQEKIVEGRLKKWLEEVVLLNQAHVNADKHDGKTIEELRTELAASTGENVVIRRFARFQIGGGVSDDPRRARFHAHPAEALRARR